MNEDNQISVWGYNAGERMLQVDFKPAVDVAGGGRKAADAGAMLWAASWRPDGKGAFKDREASPPPKGVKRVKGLPSDDLNAKSGGGAYRPKGTGGYSGVAAMMRGELDAPPKAGEQSGDRGWAATPQLTWQEQEAQQKEWIKQKKAAEKKKIADEEEAKEKAKDELRALSKKQEDGAKRLVKLKEKLATLDALKDKDWDELTEEDEAQLEDEVSIRQQIAELEKKVAAAS